MTVGSSAAPAHLAHGDRLGACLPDRLYASTDPDSELCQDPSVIVCPFDYAPFADATGCGCERQ